MALVQRTALLKKTRFSKLPNGTAYLDSTLQSGPFVKAGSGQRLATNAFKSFTSVPGGERIIELDDPSIGALQPPLAINLFTRSLGGQGAVYNGLDPVLGPPFQPLFYQLFIDLPVPFPRVTGQPNTGLPANLYWTIPQISIQVVKPQHLNPLKYRFWFSQVNDIAQAHYVDVAPEHSQYIYPSNYVWVNSWTSINAVPPVTPGGAGTLIGTGTGTTGTDFDGIIEARNIPTPNTIHFTLLAAPSIDHIELRRARGDSNFSDATNLTIQNQIGIGTTSSAGFTTPAVNASVNDGSGYLTVVDSGLVSLNAFVLITTAGLYEVTGIHDGTHITVTSRDGSNNVAAGTVILTGQRVAPVQFATDSADRDANTNYFYQLRGILTSNPYLTYIPFNNVGLIHPYLITVTAYNKPSQPTVFDHSVISWSAPTPAEVAAWPTTAP